MVLETKSAVLPWMAEESIMPVLLTQRRPVLAH